MTFQAEKKLYLSDPYHYKRRYEHLVNDYYILKKPKKNQALNDLVRNSIPTLAEEELIKAFQTAPEVVLGILEKHELQKMAATFASLTADEKKKLEESDSVLYKKTKIENESALIKNAIETKTLLPYILTLQAKDLIPYLCLVIELGEQLKEYYGKYPVATTDAYKKSPQAPASQIFMLNCDKELIYDTKVSSEEKIAYIKANPAVIQYAYKHNLDDKLSDFFTLHIIDNIEKSSDAGEIANFLSQILNKKSVTAMTKRGIWENAISKKIKSETYEMNVAQYLFSDSANALLHGAYLREPVIFQRGYLIEEISFEKFLYETDHKAELLVLPNAETPYYTAVALKHRNAISYIRPQDLDYILNLDIEDAKISAHVEKMILDREVLKTPEGSKFKI